MDDSNNQDNVVDLTTLPSIGVTVEGDSVHITSSSTSSSTPSNPRILDIINGSQNRNQSRVQWGRTLRQPLQPPPPLSRRDISAPIDKFEQEIGAFTSSEEIFSMDATGKNIYQQIGSQIDMKLHDFFNKLECDPTSNDFEKSFCDYVKFDDSLIETDCEDMIKEELGISLTDLGVYLSKYKDLLNKYFQQVIEKEKRIKSSLIQLQKFKKLVKQIKSASLLDEDEGVEDEGKFGSESVAEVRLTGALQDFISEKIEKFDATTLRKDYELNKKCFVKLINLGKQFNNVHQDQVCVICLTNNIDTVLLPCGHTGCSTCIDKIKTTSGNRRNVCYMCRSTVSKTQKIYFAN